MSNYQRNEAKRLGLLRCIDQQTFGGIVAAAVRNRTARAVRAENARRTAAAA